MRGRSSSALKILRQKYGLGEFAKKSKRRKVQAEKPDSLAATARKWLINYWGMSPKKVRAMTDQQAITAYNTLRNPPFTPKTKASRRRSSKRPVVSMGRALYHV